jgi:MFS family permease
MVQKTGFFCFLKSAIPNIVWAVGISSFLMNIATSVMFSGTALYMKTVLGTAVSTIGLLEAVVEALAYAIRMFSGILSDFLKKRKPVMLCGLTMLLIAKPMLAFSKSMGQIFLARSIDRIGNGIQATPRDALIGDIAPRENKGACYGLRQSLGVIGSTVGGILGIVIMKVTHNNFGKMFLLMSIPALLAVLVGITFIHDKKIDKNKESLRRPIRLCDLKFLGKRFWILMVVVTIFMIARFSEVFISLNACDNYGLDIAYCTVVSVIYNLVSTIVSYPAGKYSDSINRVAVLLIGFVLLFVSHLTIYLASSLSFVFVGTVLWGMQIGITQCILSTLVSEYVPNELRGTGFGVYYFITAISTAFSNIVAGFVSDTHGTESAAFLYGAVFSAMAVIALIICYKKLNPVIHT